MSKTGVNEEVIIHEYDETNSGNEEKDKEDECFYSQLATSSESVEQPKEQVTGYVILTIDQIIASMKAWIVEVQTVIFLSSSVIRVLLNRFKWDTQVLYEKYFEGEEEQAKLFKEVGITDPSKMASENCTQSKRAKVVCNICFDEYSPMKMKGMTCGHEFCLGN